MIFAQYELLLLSNSCIILNLYLSLQKFKTNYYLSQLNKTLYDVRHVA